MREEERWKDLDCVVTGGAGALGRAVVGRLLAGGARVHVPWIDEGELADFPTRDRVRLVRCDLADERAVAGFYAELPACFASIQCAGGFAMAPALETSGAEFERLWRLNALTAFLAAREAARAMRRRGGRIVFVAARPIERPVGGMVAYVASKAVVGALTEALAEEWKESGILVNAVLPSIMNTPANRAAMPDADHATWPTVEAVAETICFLASPVNSATSGGLVPVYGRA